MKLWKRSLLSMREKNAAIPKREAAAWDACVFSAYNFDNTYFIMGTFTAQSQNPASFVQN